MRQPMPKQHASRQLLLLRRAAHKLLELLQLLLPLQALNSLVQPQLQHLLRRELQPQQRPRLLGCLPLPKRPLQARSLACRRLLRKAAQTLLPHKPRRAEEAPNRRNTLHPPLQSPQLHSSRQRGLARLQAAVPRRSPLRPRPTPPPCLRVHSSNLSVRRPLPPLPVLVPASCPCSAAAGRSTCCPNRLRKRRSTW